MCVFPQQPPSLWHILQSCLLSITLLPACTSVRNTYCSALTSKQGSHQKEAHAFTLNSWYLIHIPTTEVHYGIPWLDYGAIIMRICSSTYYSRLDSNNIQKIDHSRTPFSPHMISFSTHSFLQCQIMSFYLHVRLNAVCKYRDCPNPFTS